MIKTVPVAKLQLGMYIHEIHSSWLSHPFWKSSFLLEDPADLAKIRACGIKTISVDFSRSKKPPSSPRLPTPAPTEAPTSAADIRAPALNLQDELLKARELCDRSRAAVTTMFSEVRMGNTMAVGAAREVVKEITESVIRHPQALITLARLKTSDNYTYMHSLAVCAMMVALARELAMSEEEVREAGYAGLLHDVGKMAMPESILNKPGRLSEEEFRIIKSHPEKGALILKNSQGISAPVIDVCLHHHEKFDGSGYPHGLTSDKISIYARMGAICDVYDAITSNRPYKKGWGPSESLQRMAKWQGHFDPVLFQAFVKVVGIYPVGSLVRLKSQRLAVVIEQNTKYLTKPRVKVFFSIRSSMPLPQLVVDLAQSGQEDSIESREGFEKWSFPYLEELWQGVQG